MLGCRRSASWLQDCSWACSSPCWGFDSLILQKHWLWVNCHYLNWIDSSPVPSTIAPDWNFGQAAAPWRLPSSHLFHPHQFVKLVFGEWNSVDLSYLRRFLQNSSWSFGPTALFGSLNRPFNFGVFIAPGLEHAELLTTKEILVVRCRLSFHRFCSDIHFSTQAVHLR